MTTATKMAGVDGSTFSHLESRFIQGRQALQGCQIQYTYQEVPRRIQIDAT